MNKIMFWTRIQLLMNEKLQKSNYRNAETLRFTRPK